MADCELSKFMLQSSFQGIDIPQHWSKFAAIFDEMRRKSILVDVRLICKGKKFDAHRAFLSAACEYFFHMFTSNMSETAQPEIELPSCEPEGVEVVLDILYTGKLRDVKFEELGGVLTVVHLINLTEAYVHYKRIFLDQLSASNFLVFWKIAEILDDNQILQSVYKLAPTIYKTNDFKSISEVRLKKLLTDMDVKDISSHDLKFQIIAHWTNAFKDTRISHFSELLENIDFRKVSDHQLIQILQDPLLSDSEILMNKILSISRDRFIFMMTLEKVNMLNDHIVNMFLIGRDENNKLIIQNCKMGQWMNEISLEEYGDLVEADIVYFNLNLHLITRNSEGAIMLNMLGSNGERKLSLSLGKIPVSSEMIVAQTGYCTAVIGYFPIQQDFIFIRYFLKSGRISEDRLQLYFKYTKQLRLQLLANKRQLFLIIITQSPTNHLKLFLRQYCVADNRWKEVASHTIGEGTLMTPCFARLTSSHIIVRFFPGKSYYFSLFDLKFEEREEDNDVLGIVSFDIHSNTAWCLDEVGQIFVQDLYATNSPWKLITQAPTPLMVYKNLVIPSEKL